MRFTISIAFTILALAAAAAADTAGLDAACSRGAECSPELFCKGADPVRNLQGKCTARVAEGAACNYDALCLNPSVCIEHKCSKPLGEWGVCTGDEQCIAELYCSRGKDMMKGKCNKKKAAGGECRRPAECEVGTTCFSTSSDGMCIKDGTMSGVDGVCFRHGNCQADLFCDQPQSSKRGKCVQSKGEGAACSSSIRECAESFYCSNNVCTKRKVAGEVCTSSSCANGLSCLNYGAKFGFCAEPKDKDKKAPKDGKCFVTTACDTGLYCDVPGVNELGKCATASQEGADCTVGKTMCLKGLFCNGPQPKSPKGTAGKCEQKPN